MAGGRLVVAQDGDTVEVEEPEELLARVAAIDVAKASGMVCTRVPHPAKPGRRATKVWQVPATTNAIIELAEQLARQGIQRVVVESTSDYWRAWLYLLQARGLVVWLVNARDVKHLPGRPKTDKLDAVWLAKLNERGMLRPSFVPPAEIRQLRDYTRLHWDLTAERSRVVQRLEKLLEDALIKLSTVATDIMGVSGRAMLEALVAGQRDPKALAELARGRMRGKRGALVQALTGRFDDHHAELARMLLDHYDALTAQIDRLTARIQQLIAAIPAAQVPTDGAGPTGTGDDGTTGSDTNQQPAQPPLGALDRLDEVPGIGSKAPGRHRRTRARHGPVPHPRAPGVVGQAVAPDHPVRRQAPRRRHRQGQPLPQGCARRGRRRGRQDRHLPWRTLPAAWSGASASSRPWSPSPAPSWSSSGTCSPTPPPASTTWAPATTPAASTRTARPATTSASSRRWATPSP
jgi:transposase